MTGSTDLFLFFLWIQKVMWEISKLQHSIPCIVCLLIIYLCQQQSKLRSHKISTLTRFYLAKAHNPTKEMMKQDKNRRPTWPFSVTGYSGVVLSPWKIYVNALRIFAITWHSMAGCCPQEAYPFSKEKRRKGSGWGWRDGRLDGRDWEERRGDEGRD